MKQYIRLVFLSCQFFAVQTMEEVYSPQEIIYGPVTEITNSYFQDNLNYSEYKKSMEELLFGNYKFKKGYFPFLNLIEDVSDGSKIRKVSDYGAEKIVLPGSYEPLLYIPEKECQGLSLRELSMHRICEHLKKENYSQLKQKFANMPLKVLQDLLEYPNFPESLQKSILKAAYKVNKIENNKMRVSLLDRVGKNIIDFLIKIKSELQSKSKIQLFKIDKNSGDINGVDVCKSTETWIHKEDYKTNTYSVLKNILNKTDISHEMKNKINIYLDRENLPYCKKKTGKLFNDIISLPKIDNEYKEKILSLLIKMQFDGEFLPYKLLPETVKYYACNDFNHNYNDGIWTSKYGFQQYSQLYIWIMNYCFQKYPLYTAQTLTDLAVKTQNLEEKRVALGIVKSHQLLQWVVDSNIAQYASDAKFLSLLLDHNIKFSSAIIHEIVKVDNLEALVLLKERGIDLSDPVFISIALKAGSFACLYFLLDYQKNNLDDLTTFDEIIPKLVKNVSEQNIYKTLLHAKCTGDICPLESTSFDIINSKNNPYNGEKREEIKKGTKAIEDVYWRSIDDEILKKIDENTRSIKQIITELSFAKLELLQQDKDFLPDLLCQMEKVQKNLQGKYGYHLNYDIVGHGRDFSYKVAKLLIYTESLLGGAFLMPNTSFDARLGLAYCGVFCGVLLWIAQREEREREKRNKKTAKILSSYKHIYYLKGLILGLNDENKKVYNLQEVQEKNLIGMPQTTKTKMYCISALSGILPFIVNKNIAGECLIFFSMLHVFPFFMDFCRALWDLFWDNNSSEQKQQKLSSFLISCEQKGRADGLARINLLKEKYNNPPNRELLPKIPQQKKESIFNNNLFFKIWQRCKRRYNLLGSYNYDEIYSKLKIPQPEL